jgi:hypothetical protein
MNQRIIAQTPENILQKKIWKIGGEYLPLRPNYYFLTNLATDKVVNL